jgi:uncharacterized alpha-E superfamily protein
MLSRTADNLYWMGRYSERAENTARILDVSWRASLGRQPVSDWEAALASLTDPTIYAERYGEPTQTGLLAFMTLDPENPSSIFSSIKAGRENARSLRATITTEMWESLNATWLEIKELDVAAIQRQGFREFFDWVKHRSHLFRGVMIGTMMHDDALRFVQLGTFLERADNTARLFDAKQNLLRSSTSEEGSALDYYQWGGVLRAVSAFRAYHQIYADVITPTRVAELLVLKPEMPRSLRFCTDQVVRLLDELAGGRVLDSRRVAGELDSRLRYGRIEDIAKRGLHDFLVEFMDRVSVLSDGISRDFLMFS